WRGEVAASFEDLNHDEDASITFDRESKSLSRPHLQAKTGTAVRGPFSFAVQRCPIWCEWRGFLA
ncbi:MAG: hypothetical protein WBC93_07095, partial [Sulfitobacter sp.]